MVTSLTTAMAAPVALLAMATALGMAMEAPATRLATATSWLELLSG